MKTFRGTTPLSP